MKTLILLFVISCPVFGQNQFDPTTFDSILTVDIGLVDSVDYGSSIYAYYRTTYDTVATRLIVAVDSVKLSDNAYYRFPIKVFALIDGYAILENGWITGKYLNKDKNALKEEVFLSFGVEK